MGRSALLSLRSRPALALGLVCLLATGGALYSQDAALYGVVTDPVGAVVPGATITLTRPATGFRRSTVSDPEGRYQFPQVNPGTFDVTGRAPGFAASLIRQVHLQVDTATRLDLELSLKEVSARVTVEGEAPATHNAQNASVGNAFTASQIVGLPLKSRDIVNLLTLQPAVTPEGEFAGVRRDQSNLMLDGIDVNDNQQPGSQPGLDPSRPGSPQVLSPVLRVTPDSVQALGVTVMNPSARQGRSSGGQISFVTRSGTNQLHGSLYHLHRNTVANANDFFNNRVGVERPALIRNMFGLALGGPIVRNKAFFFFNYEGRRDQSEATQFRPTPLPHLGRGEVQYIGQSGDTVRLGPDDLATLYPETGGVNPLTVALFADAAARYAANDQGDAVNTGGFRFNAPTPLGQNALISRLDFHPTDQHRFFLRGNVQWDSQSSPPRWPDKGAPSIWSHPTGLSLGHTWTPHPASANTLRFGVTRQAFSTLVDSASSSFNFTRIFLPRWGGVDTHRVTPTVNLTDDLSHIRGKHILQFGANLRWMENRRSRSGAFSIANTIFSAYPQNSLIADLPDIAGSSRLSYQDAASAVLGRLSSYSSNLDYGSDGALLPRGTPADRIFSTGEYDLYFEDRWRPTSQLTISLGLRWGVNTPVREDTGFQLAPDTGLGAFLEARQAGAAQGNPVNDLITLDRAGPFWGRKGYYDTDWNNFMPRVAVAWSPGFNEGLLGAILPGEGRSVLRGGFAVSYDRVGSQLAVTLDQRLGLGFLGGSRVPRFFFNVTDRPAPLFTGFDMSIRDLPGLNDPERLDFPLSWPVDDAWRVEGTLDDSLQVPVYSSWSFSFGRELPGGLFVEATYLGRRARNLLATQDIVHPNNLVDPLSGQSFYEAARLLADARSANVPIAEIAPIPFFENLFSRASGSGAWHIDPNLTATQNAYRFVSREGINFPDWTFFQETWNHLGDTPNVFFHPQYHAFMAFSSLARSDYHGLAVSLRQRLQRTLMLDLNYTWSKSMDMASGLQDADLTSAGSAALIRNPLDPDLDYAESDFDTRHILNANWLWEVPVGAHHAFGSSLSPVLQALVGGWAVNGIFRWNSGLPFDSPVESGLWNTNWQVPNSAVRVRDPGASPHKGGDHPNYWADPEFAYRSFRNTYAGEVGDRNVLRGQSYLALDLGLNKVFSMPYNERHSLIFRWETFNVTNTQRLGRPGNHSVRVDPQLGSPSRTFGRINSTQGSPRVMQFGLRYEF